MSVPLQFPIPHLPPAWAASRHTDDVVAAGIHSVAHATRRPPEAVWEDPTPLEFDQVCMFVDNVTGAGEFYREPSGVYNWGVAPFRAHQPETEGE